MSQDSSTRLRKVALFRDLEEAEVAAVVQLCQRRPFTTGDALFVQGERGDTLLFVVDGRLRVEIDGPGGQRIELGAVAAGQIVGEMAVLDPAPRLAHVVAASDGAAFELSAAGLRALRSRAPAAAAAITATIIHDVTARIRHINERIDQELGGAPGDPAKPLPGAAPGDPAKPAPASATAVEERGVQAWWARLFRG